MTTRTFEPFVTADVVAEHLSLIPRMVLSLARMGEIPAYPIGRGERKMWRFKLSEVDAAFSKK